MRNIAMIAALLAALPLAAQDPKQEPTPPAPAPTLEKPQMAPATEETKPVEKPKAGTRESESR